MKVAFVGQKGIPATQGGIERNTENVVVGLVESGVDVIVYTRPHYTPKSLKEYRGVRLISLPSIRTKRLDAGTHTFLSILHAIYIERVDIIHFQAIGPSFLSFIPRILAPHIKIVSTFHSLDMEHGKWGWFARLMLTLGARAACVFPHCTFAVSQKIRHWCKFHTKKDTVYLPYGVDIDLFSPDAQEREEQKGILSRFGVLPKKYIVYVGRLVRHKGVHYIIEAFQRVQQKYPELSEYKLLIVGGGAFTNTYVNFVRRLASRNHAIVLAGEQAGDTLRTLFRNAFLYVSATESEGLSIASLEAMAWRLPIVVSNIPENLELFWPEKRNLPGYTFANKNIKELTTVLAYALLHPAESFERGKRARDIIVKFHNNRDITQKILNTYLRLVPMEVHAGIQVKESMEQPL